MERIKIPNSKGQGISAVIHESATETGRLAILCPGYLDTKDYQHLTDLAEVLQKEGYTAVRFDPTGTWESEGDISEYSTTQYLEDIKSVLEYMLTRFPYKEILLGGHSRGGQVSILYAARDSRITQVVGIMPSSRPVSGERRKIWEEAGVSVGKRELPDDKDTKIEFNVSFSHVLDRDQYDTLEDVKKIKASLVLVAGELDVLAPPNEVRDVFDNANEPKIFMVADGIDHEYRHRPSEIAEINQLIVKALREHV